MKDYKHSVSLNAAKCKGCTHCLKRCPTEAIRIREGKAEIDTKRCIDCGECIRVCPYRAKKAICDVLSDLDKFKYKIALPAPSLYGQFDNLDDIEFIIDGLYKAGFDMVFEVAKAAEIVSCYTRMYLRREDIRKPVISSACPVIGRLIGMRFPYLLTNLMPLLPPMEIAAQMARERALEEHPELSPEDIGVCFISPCPAKVSYVKNSTTTDVGKSSVDVIISIREIYFLLIDLMNSDELPEHFTESGMIGISWASTGGESSAIFNEKYLAADGIENVIKVLDQIENAEFTDLEFVELNACPGGCVGGVMTVANPYIAKARLQSLKRYLPVSPNWVFDKEEIPTSAVDLTELTYTPAGTLSEFGTTAMQMMAKIQEIRETLPDIDCGFCGAPTCAAFAEDVVRGEAHPDDCILRLREKLGSIPDTMGFDSVDNNKNGGEI